MRTDLFDFELPRERIALRPADPRDAARLLVMRPKRPFEDRIVRELPDLLRPGDRIVLNDTKVIPARLNGRVLKGVEPRIEATLHRRLDGSHWHAFLKPARKAAVGDVIRFGDEGKVCFLGQLDARVEAKADGGDATLAFAFHGAVLDQAIEERGDMPLPPYIAARRAPDDRDRRDYQTVFARKEGSVAAPTAALHFTDALLANLQARGIGLTFVTLHVGAGTFLPVKAEDTAQHRLHPEGGLVGADAARAINGARERGGRVIAAGTTSLRARRRCSSLPDIASAPPTHCSRTFTCRARPCSCWSRRFPASM
jgi:S-adenosylmethionine:tRNA ribosyltransferase-isomerase